MVDVADVWGSPRYLASADYLLRTHTLYEHCFIVMDGFLTRERVLDNGNRQIVGMHIPGDICGLAALSDGRAAYDTVALSSATCLPVARRWIWSIARESLELSHVVWNEMSREMALSDAWIVNLGQRPAAFRLGYFLCELEARLRAAGHATDDGFDWPGTQSDISAITGLSLVHVNRTLNKLRSDHLEVRGRRMRFRDVAKLRTAVDFDPAYLAIERHSLADILQSRIDVASRRDVAARPPLGLIPVQ